MTLQDTVAQLVRQKGPLLPVAINKELKTNVLFAAAMLSELVDRKQLRLTTMKIGGSPLYYTPGQEEKLQLFSHHLPEKERRTYDLLREKKILRDKEQEPLVRATLREIKDFAVKLEVETAQSMEIFWKWYLLPTPAAEELIRPFFDEAMEEKISLPAPSPSMPSPPLHPLQPVVNIPFPPESAPRQEPMPMARSAQETRKEQEKEKQSEEKKGEQASGPPRPRAAREDGSRKEEKQQARENEGAKEKSLQEEPAKNREPAVGEKQIISADALFMDTTGDKDKFFKKVQSYCAKNEISIISYKINKRETEIDLHLLIPSNVGKLHYYCKARNKMRCNDGDLSTAYIQSQAQKLPILFLTTGDVTKKAGAMAAQEFKTMTIQKI